MLDETREFGFCSCCGVKLQLVQKVNVAESESESLKLFTAKTLIKSGHFIKAKELLKEIVREDPTNGEAWQELALVDLKQFIKLKHKMWIPEGLYITGIPNVDLKKAMSFEKVKQRILKEVKALDAYNKAEKLLGNRFQKVFNEVIGQCEVIVNNLLIESNEKIKRINKNNCLLNGYYKRGYGEESSYRFFSYEDEICVQVDLEYFKVFVYGSNIRLSLKNTSAPVMGEIKQLEKQLQFEILYISPTDEIYTTLGNFKKDVKESDYAKEKYKKMLKERNDHGWCLMCGSQKSFFGRCKVCGRK